MPTLQESLDRLLHSNYRNNSPGAAVLVAKAGEPLYQGSAGLADVGSGADLTPSTNFRMASVSKQFTAMCVHLLSQKNALHLTDSLCAYFPELAHFAEATLNHLLNHTSGLPDFEEHLPASQVIQLTDEDVLQLTAAQQRLLFSPGTQYRYSNTAYVLLGLLVERVSGMAYAEFLQEHIFRPLHMHNSRLYHPAADIPHRAMGYAFSESGELVLSDQGIGTATRGDGCIYISLSDYQKWHKALSGNTVFNITITPNTNPSVIDRTQGWHYHMGWFFAEVGNGTREFFHSGDTSGFTNLVIRLPQREVLIACFSNIADNWAFLGELLDALAQFPELCLGSPLVRHLQQLTR